MSTPMWKCIYTQLCDLSEGKFVEHVPEVRLLMQLICMEAKDRNDAFLSGDTFRKYCYLMRVSPMYLRDVFERAWVIEDKGIAWAPTPCADDDLNEVTEEEYWGN